MCSHSLILLLSLLVGSPLTSQTQPVAEWDFRRSADDQRSPSSTPTRVVGSPRIDGQGAFFDGRRVQGFLYGSGAGHELSLRKHLTLWVQTSFGRALTRPLANHDTLMSRWGQLGSYSFLLRSDHHTKTLCLFLSDDGKRILSYDSGYRVVRTGSTHDLAVVVRAGQSVQFYVDGRRWCELRYPVPPRRLHVPPPDAAPFAVGYNHDPAPGNDHETMNGRIIAAQVFRQAVTAEQIARLSNLSPQQAAQTRREILVDARREVGRVHPYLFGHFLEHFQDVVYGGLFDPNSLHADAAGFRVDALKALRALRPTVIRWPGGNYTSAYHWRWGAVPRKHRPIIHDEPVWRQTESHAFGTPEFIQLCRRLEAEPLICVGVGRDPRCPTPEEAAAWVRYCNATEGAEAQLRAEAGYPEPFNVVLWGLGNEVYGRWQIGHYANPGDYAADLIKCAREMRKADPRVRFVVCGDSYKTDNTVWNKAVLTDEVAQIADWISYHTYVHMGSFGPRLPHEVAIHRLLRIESDLEGLIELNRRRSPHSSVKLAVDEWNELSWGDQKDNAVSSHYNLAHALYTASFLNAMLRHADDVTMANYSPSVNCRGLIQVDHRGVLKRSTCHIFAMYRACAEGQAVAVTSDVPRLDGSGAPVIDVVAVRGQDGALRLYAVNRDPNNSYSCSINLKGFVVAQASGQVVTGASLDAYNDFDHADDVVVRDMPVAVEGSAFTYRFPPRSACLLVLRAGP